MKKIGQRMGTLLFALSFLFVSIAKAQTFMTNGLVSYYPFDGDAKDKIGQNHGVVTGATLAPDMFGRAKRAYKFDGQNNWVELPGTTFPLRDYTVSLWFNAAELPTVPNAAMLISGARHFVEVHLGIGDPEYVQTGIRFLPNFYSGGSIFYDDPATAIETGNWYHLVVTYSSTNGNGTVTVNGKSRPLFQRWGPDTPVNSVSGRIGARHDGTYPFKGIIDGIRIYNRALSFDEAKRLYSLESTTQIPLEIEVASIRLRWPSEFGAVYEIQYSTAFQDWTVLKTVVGTGETIEYIDPVEGEKRFYRLVKK